MQAHRQRQALQHAQSLILLVELALLALEEIPGRNTRARLTNRRLDKLDRNVINNTPVLISANLTTYKPTIIHIKTSFSYYYYTTLSVVCQGFFAKKAQPNCAGRRRITVPTGTANLTAGREKERKKSNPRAQTQKREDGKITRAEQLQAVPALAWISRAHYLRGIHGEAGAGCFPA
jgi:hypothetical protein